MRQRLKSHPLPELTPTRTRQGAEAKRGAARGAVPPALALLLLAAARAASAAWNIIHDCDETFNYLEPLHYLLFGSGLQTWEYGAQFALRSYLYLLLHGVVAAPVAAVLGAGAGKVAAFYAIRLALATASVLTEWWLYRAVARQYRPAVANAFLALLCCTAGMFAASTGFLPSSFTMYALTAAAAGVLEGRPYAVIAAAVIGVVWGWCVAGVAFLPYALYVLAAAPFLPAVGVGLLCLLGALGPLVLCDRFYYGKWTASLWNFVRYNVVGGGESALYGVEGPAYYLRNGFNNFSLALPLALALPALALLAGLKLPLGSAAAKGRLSARQGTLRLLGCVAPLYAWLAAITALPHKEERFLFVAYPLICLAAAASLAALSDWAGRLLALLLPACPARTAARFGSVAALAVVGLLGVSRSAALVRNYGAPMTIYRYLPELPANASEPQHVCVGAEWHRFPSAFFLPGPAYRLQFIKSGFSGLLPRPFDPAKGGTAAAPPQLNDKNREEPANYWASPAGCAYLVTLQEGPAVEDNRVDNLGGLRWETVASLPFVDIARSPPLARAFFIPGWSERRNHYVRYVLLRQVAAPPAEAAPMGAVRAAPEEAAPADAAQQAQEAAPSAGASEEL